LIPLNSNIEQKINHYLLLCFAFAFPISVAIGNLILGLILINFLIFGDIKSKIEKILENKLAIASIVFFLIHLISLLWTENIEWGITILKKMKDFIIVLPVFLVLVNSNFKSKYINIFLSSIFLSSFLSYMVFFEFIEPFHRATISNPTPTMSHISFPVFLVMAFYTAFSILMKENGLALYYKAWLWILISMTSINIFIIGGRTGQILFLFSLFLIFIEYFRSKFRLSLTILLFTPIFILLMVNFSQNFNKRIDQTIKSIDSIMNMNDRHTSIGQRYDFFLNSLDIIKANPILGVGVGDFPDEYEKIRIIKNRPSYVKTVNPHNMYILILAQLGIFGLISLIYLLFVQYKISRNNSSYLRNIGRALPLFFSIIMLSDSYLLGHFTTMLFVFFSGILYSNKHI